MRCNHPLRTIRAIANDALAALTADFDALYSQFGRPSIPPEQLLRAMLLQAFYGIRSERQLMERIEFDLLFRWFTGLGVDDPVWDHSTFSKNRDRLLEGEIAAKFLQAVLAQPKVKRLVSNDHFSVDGTLLEAWASMKSFRKTDGSDDDDDDGSGRNGERNFHGEKRSNKTHRSTTDPDAKLYRKGNGQPAKLCYLGHALMENRNGLAVGGGVTQASGTAEREAALNLVERRRGRSKRRITLGADKAYDVTRFVADLRARSVTPHITINGHLTKTGKRRKTAIDRRTLRHAGYEVSQRHRKRIEEVFGWIKSSAGLAKVKLRGRAACAAWLFSMRWPEGFQCPGCGHDHGWALRAKAHTFECTSCHRQTPVTAGTILHGSKLDLTVWFWAAYLMATHSNGISALQLQKQLALGSYRTAWMLAAKLRRAMVDPDRNPLSGLVEIDETSLPFRTKNDPASGGPGRSHDGKLLVVGGIEVGDGNKPGRLRLAALTDYGAGSLNAFIARNIAPASTAKTDGWAGYAGVPVDQHDPHVIGAMAAHLVLPWIHQMFSNLKGWARGVYHGLRRKYLQTYLDEFVFRFNRRRTRHPTFRSMFAIAIRTKPVTYNMLVAPEQSA